MIFDSQYSTIAGSWKYCAVTTKWKISSATSLISRPYMTSKSLAKDASVIRYSSEVLWSRISWNLDSLKEPLMRTRKKSLCSSTERWQRNSRSNISNVISGSATMSHLLFNVRRNLKRNFMIWILFTNFYYLLTSLWISSSGAFLLRLEDNDDPLMAPLKSELLK